MASLASQVNSSLRRTFSGMGWSEGSNETDTFPTRIHRRVEGIVGASRMKYVAFASIISMFFLYILAIQGIEESYESEYNVSVFHKNPFFPPKPPFYPTNSSDIITSPTPTAAPTLSINGTIADGGTIVIKDASDSDPSYTLFVSILMTMLAWIMMVQIITCIRRGGLSGSSSLAQRRQQLQEEQRRSIIEQFRFLSAVGRRQLSPAMMQRLRLAFVQRDFTGDDYEMLMQLDDAQGGGLNNANSRRGAPRSIIERLPSHRLTQGDIDKMTKISKDHTPKASDAEESIQSPKSTVGVKNSRQEFHVAPQCHICLAPYEVSEEVRTLPCLHQFHKPCIDQWLQTNAVCPICKFSISADEERGV